MAGHSKFKNIQHRKGAQDKKRAKVFTRLIKELSVAARFGIDPENNSRLRTAILSCRSANMPKENIDRVLKKVEGGETENYQEIRYEGFGIGGTAFLIECVTDNKNRTASEVRSAFSKYGGNLGETGSVSFMFERVGEICFFSDKINEDEIFEKAIEFEAKNFNKITEEYVIVTHPDDFVFIKEKLENCFGSSKEANIIWEPKNLVNVNFENSMNLYKFIDVLDDIDDIQSFYFNFEFSDEFLNKL